MVHASFFFLLKMNGKVNRTGKRQCGHSLRMSPILADPTSPCITCEWHTCDATFPLQLITGKAASAVSPPVQREEAAGIGR